MSKTAGNGAVPADMEQEAAGTERIKELEDYAKALFEKMTLDQETEPGMDGEDLYGR